MVSWLSHAWFHIPFGGSLCQRLGLAWSVRNKPRAWSASLKRGRHEIVRRRRKTSKASLSPEAQEVHFFTMRALTHKLKAKPWQKANLEDLQTVCCWANSSQFYDICHICTNWIRICSSWHADNITRHVQVINMINVIAVREAYWMWGSSSGSMTLTISHTSLPFGGFLVPLCWSFSQNKHCITFQFSDQNKQGLQLHHYNLSIFRQKQAGVASWGGGEFALLMKRRKGKMKKKRNGKKREETDQ